jgi:curved DNA-binding protein CbpA
MTEAEGRDILQINPGASAAEVLAAYRKVMNLVHPEHA